MSNINNKALHVINSLRTQMALQLREKADSSLDIAEMQLQLKETLDKAKMIAKSSPDGLITIALANRPLNYKISPEEVLLGTDVQVSFFNTNNFKQHLTRTVIVIDKMWTSKFRVYRCSYGVMGNNYLKED